ncbi:hypothetical protein PC129_g20012 [Phytophthora cactorum]|uniref:Uncharacterized protein n=1 Tax=Phytophthora cactorum TaxID=29920 RepID=A0A329RRF4_9STRA|nr:hypothetical protein Pcac1_g16449 [Phytophthora cactorum]KAG2797753.1 hypothetical protein PC111_g21151 [Phytophthora cactorum]KAG2798132.1 hypothetical protein PC112_g21490 [Phytophthora cactorum]KAG2824311.1 hypothetical protein PC113_g22056 [Phytophthora cactorum]KAG2877046.1 hypothetical protein PC114_g23867 [Phytophthora cactorum]
MSSSTLPRGSYLLLFPDDLDHPITSPVYAKVKISKGTTVSVTVLTEGEAPEPTIKLSRATVLAQKVPNSDAEGLKLRTWIRQAVCVSSGGQFRYGHVTGYSESGVIISTKAGPIEATRNEICDSVYTVVAMTMGCHQFSLET